MYDINSSRKVVHKNAINVCNLVLNTKINNINVFIYIYSFIILSVMSHRVRGMHTDHHAILSEF